MVELRLDLNDLLPLWERKFANRTDEPVAHRLVGRDVDLAVTAGEQNRSRNPAALTQDIVRTIIIRQRRIQR